MEWADRKQPIVDMLLSRREMLADLSSLRICADGRDDTLAVLPDHTPLPARPRGHSYTERKDRGTLHEMRDLVWELMILWQS